MPLSFGVRAASGIPRDAAFACACKRKAVPRSTSSRLVTALQNILSASAALREYFTLPVGYGRQVNELGMRPAEWFASMRPILNAKYRDLSQTVFRFAWQEGYTF